MNVILNGKLHLCIACWFRLHVAILTLDRYNYARCATIYWFDMELLKHRCPNEYKECAAANFSLFKTNKQFSRMTNT